MPEKKTPFARFFSSVEGHLVSRYGSGTSTHSAALIGASRDPETGAPSWDTAAVTAITEDEAKRFRREYDQAVQQGALVERSEDDYLAAVAAEQPAATQTTAS